MCSMHRTFCGCGAKKMPLRHIEFLEELFGSMNDGFWKLDVYTGSLWCSRDIVGRNFESSNDFFSIVHEDDRMKIAKLFEDIITNPSDEFLEQVIRVYDSDSGIHWVLFKGKILDEKECTIAGIFIDTTLISENTELYKKMVIELHRRNKCLQEIVHIVSHDLKEPASKICTFADIALEKEMEESAKSCIERIKKSSLWMQKLISDLLDYSKISSSKQEFERVNLKDIMSEISDEFSSKNIRIFYDLLPEIDANPTHMRQLFGNIINNAIKFRNGVTCIINVKHKIVETDNDDFVNIYISDNGIGFDNSHRDNIFNVFTRLNNKGDYEGTGIGLSICQQIVFNHGGTISADGNIGEGACFTVCLPLNQGEYYGKQ